MKQFENDYESIVFRVFKRYIFIKGFQHIGSKKMLLAREAFKLSNFQIDTFSN